MEYFSISKNANIENIINHIAESGKPAELNTGSADKDDSLISVLFTYCPYREHFFQFCPQHDGSAT